LTDGAKIARLTALLAGNGFILSQIFSLYMESIKDHGYRRMDLSVASIAAFALLGIACAYCALAFTENRRASATLEAIGTGVFALALGLWFAFGLLCS